MQLAAEWYDKAAKNGSGRSANNLGLLYKDGLGVEKSEAKAFKYFEYAVQQSDDSAAMVNLADCYFNGVGTNNDHAKGMKWLQMAADKGDLRVESLLKLRKIVGFDENQFKFFDENQNAPFNYSQYGKYVKEAAENGSKTAQRHMEIWKNMSDSMKAYKEKDPAQLVAALSKAIRLASDLVVFPKFFEQMIIASLIFHHKIKTHFASIKRQKGTVRHDIFS
uniref:Sel1 repeat family protein n=1 Tax=Panagrolaimus superbus TaxID=310955 RepID=A0A914YUY5_9BILA